MNLRPKIQVNVFLIAIWTMFQTVFHLIGTIYLYLLTTCRVKTTYYDIIFLYFTYFYKSSCGLIDISENAWCFPKNSPWNDSYTDIYNFLNLTMNRAQWPNKSRHAVRSELHLILFLVVDGAWFVGALLLAGGSWWRPKNFTQLVFMHGPWLVFSALVISLDVFVSVTYGIDLISIKSYSTWMQFVGVSNYEEFTFFDLKSTSSFLPAFPTVLIILLTSRFFVIWLVNIVCFFTILFMTVPSSVERRSHTALRSVQGGGRLSREFSTSETRIRNWQLFYGAVEASSTMTSLENTPSDCNDNLTPIKSKITKDVSCT
ncbi:hypothetical protein ABEB36_001935 [Hypothenemus hampei]|uniref:Uncharacterized protein n=1 Tax=Hypothenemus hampei TaxID=57062 RepID=A0ABD1FGA8_HYPHA